MTPREPGARAGEGGLLDESQDPTPPYGADLACYVGAE